MADTYASVYGAWKNDPEAFWAEAAKGIDWDKPWDKVFDAQAGVYGRWFAGAECNTAYNCLDRHVKAGRGEQAALIYDSPMTGKVETFTYAELTNKVATLAGVLNVSLSWVLHGIGTAPAEDNPSELVKTISVQLERLKRLQEESEQLVAQIEDDLARFAANG